MHPLRKILYYGNGKTTGAETISAVARGWGGCTQNDWIGI